MHFLQVKSILNALCCICEKGWFYKLMLKTLFLNTVSQRKKWRHTSWLWLNNYICGTNLKKSEKSQIGHTFHFSLFLTYWFLSHPWYYLNAVSACELNFLLIWADHIFICWHSIFINQCIMPGSFISFWKITLDYVMAQFFIAPTGIMNSRM